jgi:hypothetical protein
MPGDAGKTKVPTRARVAGRVRWTVVVVAATPILLGVACVALILLASFGLPQEWEIPDGYQGWVGLTLENPDCPPLRRRGLTTVIAVDKTGRACTSDGLDNRFRSIAYVYVAPDGRRTPLPSHDRTYQGVQASRGGIAGSSDDPYQIDHAYIGTWDAAYKALLSDLIP